MEPDLPSKDYVTIPARSPGTGFGESVDDAAGLHQ
jgi:hypothetical protein